MAFNKYAPPDRRLVIIYQTLDRLEAREETTHGRFTVKYDITRPILSFPSGNAFKLPLIDSKPRNRQYTIYQIREYGDYDEVVYVEV